VSAYRFLFALAALSNAFFAAWLGLWPHAFFATFEMPEPPGLLRAAVLSVIVLFGLAYTWAACYPERADLVIALGLASKIGGPLTWLALVACDLLPATTFPVTLFGDILWWFPFLAYLLRRRSDRRLILAWVVVAVHLLACIGLLAIAPGTEVEPDVAARRDWVAAHRALWCANWLIWAIASVSLVAFTVPWMFTLIEHGASRNWAVAGCLLVVLGVPFDLVGETQNIVEQTRPERSPEDFWRTYRTYSLLSAGTANGLYCAGGLLLSVLAWRVGWLRGAVGLLGIGMWSVGLALTAAVIADARLAMIAMGGGVMVLYLPWAALVGWRMRDSGEPPRSGFGEKPPR
jgi:hypothetical protein